MHLTFICLKYSIKFMRLQEFLQKNYCQSQFIVLQLCYMDKVNILGINISILNKKEILGKINEFLKSRGKHQIATINPEFLLTAQTDEEFYHILNTVDLAVPDGIGLVFAGWASGIILERYSGADLAKDILKIAGEKKLKVGILNWNRGLSKKEEIKKALILKYPTLNFIVADTEKNNKALIEDLISFDPDILFSTLGAPWQEKIIYHALKSMASIKLGMGVGGGFDFLTGKIKRAPKIFQRAGLEWLWRLIKQPTRYKRIINAVIIFPLVFLKWKFILPFFYRKNIACLIYKKENERLKILIVKRSGTLDHWQIPQGGLDGKSCEQAALQEIKEELGIKKIEIKVIYRNIFKYDFNERIGKYNTETKKARGYKGQIQSLAVAEYSGDGNEIKINYWDHAGWKWIESDNLINELHPLRRESGELFLKKLYELEN